MSENETRPISQTAGYNIDKDPKEMTSIVKLKKSTTSTIEVGTVTTLPAGSDATVENSGDDVNAIFDFGIPQGAKGDKGDKGDTGEKGATGETGAQGATGATPNISMSATVDGQTGTPSVNVTKSGTAENPNFNMSFSGLKGAKGDKGDTGDTGARGETGATPNISATASVDNTTGTPAVVVTRSGSAAAPNIDFSFSGLKGEQGAQGVQGEKGEKGDKGDAGSAGNITATASVDATTGTPAVVVTKSGTNENPNFDFSFSGLKGAKGDTGETGATGAQGATGATPNISATASVDNTTGTPAVVVTKSGSVDAPNINFSFTGLKGEQGAQGIQGETGAQGIQGETGATGATPNISASASVDATTGTPAVTVTKSGTAENPNFDFAFSGLKGESAQGGGGVKYAKDTGTMSATRNGNYLCTYSKTITGQAINTALQAASKIHGFILKISGVYDIQTNCNYFIPFAIEKTAGSSLSAMQTSNILLPHTSVNVPSSASTQAAFDGYVLVQGVLVTNNNIILSVRVKPYTAISTSAIMFDADYELTMLYEE